MVIRRVTPGEAEPHANPPAPALTQGPLPAPGQPGPAEPVWGQRRRQGGTGAATPQHTREPRESPAAGTAGHGEGKLRQAAWGTPGGCHSRAVLGSVGGTTL